MAVSNFHLQSNQSFTSFFFPLDHKSPVLAQFPDFDSFFYERGPRYEAYADLRESRLRAKRSRTKTPEEVEFGERSILSPKKEVKFEVGKRGKGSSILAQSVPDFAAVLRKENRKPSSPLPPLATPPSGLKNGTRVFKSLNSSGEKRGARKSCANIQELKGLASIARGAINGEIKGGVTTRASTRNVLRSSRHF